MGVGDGSVWWESVVGVDVGSVWWEWVVRAIERACLQKSM